MSTSLLLTMAGWAAAGGAAQEYNNDTNLWSSLASDGAFNSTTSAAQLRTAGGWDGNRWYVISISGGLHAYTPATNTWQTNLVSGTAIITSPTSSHWVMTSDGSYIYILASNNDFRRYDPSSDALTALATPAGTYGIGIYLTYDGSGSIYGSKGTGSQKYSIASNSWTTLASDDGSTTANYGAWAAVLGGNLYKIQIDGNDSRLKAYQYIVSGNVWVTKAVQQANAANSFYDPPSPGGEDSDTSIRVWSTLTGINGPSYIYNIVSNTWTAGPPGPNNFGQGNNYVVTRAFSAAFTWYQSDGITLVPTTVNLGVAAAGQILTYHAKVKTPVARASGVTISVPTNTSTDAATVVTICNTFSGVYSTQFSTGALNIGDEVDVYINIAVSTSQTLGLAKRFFLEVSPN